MQWFKKFYLTANSNSALDHVCLAAYHVAHHVACHAAYHQVRTVTVIEWDRL